MGHTSSKNRQQLQYCNSTTINSAELISKNSNNINNQDNNNISNNITQPIARFNYDQSQPPPDIDYYVIRLNAEQSVGLYGFLLAKTTLTWRDILQNDLITFGTCVSSGIPSSKLNRMQPDIKEWISHGKATLEDCENMCPWYKQYTYLSFFSRFLFIYLFIYLFIISKYFVYFVGRKPNPFTDFGCSVGDLVLYRKMLPPSVLKQCGITFSILCNMYGLTPDIMILLKYSLDDWLDLEITPTFIAALSSEQWFKMFGNVSRSEILAKSTTSKLTN